MGTGVLRGERRWGVSAMEQLRETVLDGVLLRDKSSGAGDWLHPCPSWQLDLGAVETLRYIQIEHSFEEDPALWNKSNNNHILMQTAGIINRQCAWSRI